MNSYFHALNTSSFNTKPVLSKVYHSNCVNMDTPAIEVMDDFTQFNPVAVHYLFSYEHIKDVLTDTHSEYALIEDNQGLVVGLLPITDLMGLRSMIRAVEFRQPLKDLVGRDLMTSITDIPVLEMDDIERSKVGDVVFTFKKHFINYLSVVDDSYRLRGIFSARKLSKALDMQLDVGIQSQSVIEIAQAINGFAIDL